MERTVEVIGELLYKKIILYQDLVQVLRKEREHLAKADVDALWEVSAEKQELVVAVEAIRDQVLASLSEISVDHGMKASTFSLSRVVSLVPYPHERALKKAHLTLLGLKAEVRQLSRENKAFIEQSLDFLDEIIGLIARSGDGAQLYDDGGVVSDNRRSTLLLLKEA